MHLESKVSFLMHVYVAVSKMVNAIENFKRIFTHDPIELSQTMLKL